MELEQECHERISAPLHLVWEEMDSLDRCLTKTPQIFWYEVEPGGQRARGQTKLAWGPVKWTVGLDVTLLGITGNRQIRYAIEAKDLDTRIEITIDLALAGRSETRLHYHCTLAVRHRMAGRMRGLFHEIAEEQAHSILHLVKIKSEQRRLAQERLLA